jgi:MFS family permease
MAGRTGKKKIFVFSGYFTSTVFKVLLAMSNTLGLAIVVSSLERLGKGLRNAPRDAIIAESMPQHKGKAFGFHRAMDTSGAMLGSVFALLILLFYNNNYKLILIIAAALSVICLIPIAFVKEQRTEPQKRDAAEPAATISRGLKLFLAIAATFALGNFSYMFFVLRAKDFFSDKLAYILPVLLYILFNIVGALAVYPLGVLGDKIGKQKVIVLGYLFFSVACFGFMFVRTIAGLAVLFVFYGISVASVDSNQRAYVSDLAGGQSKSAALGVYHTAVGLAALPAGIIAGLLWKSELTFIFGGTVGLICAALFIIRVHSIEEKKLESQM